MAIPLYLAQTAAEFASAQEQTPHLAWMACHFSPYGTGLTNVPIALPPKSLLILNDRTPIHGHDPKRVLETLEEAVTRLDCSGVLLDFQRADCCEAADIAAALLALPCPVAVSELYAQNLRCPVFLPPVPPNKLIQTHTQDWSGREIWLEAALDSICCTVTENGSAFTSAVAPGAPAQQDERLHCHYQIGAKDDSIVFSIWRTREDLQVLLNEAEAFGITQAIGLWQELKNS